MGYSRQTYERVNAIFAERRAEAERGAENRRKQIYAELPEINTIDRQLSATGALILLAYCDPAAMQGIETQNLALQEERAKVLADAGYPADYTEPKYVCGKCCDTGFVGMTECICRKRELVLAGYENSGIGNLLKTQTFDNFTLDRCDESVRTAYAVLRHYAESFRGDGDDNLLLVGGTGLGKTHLSSAVAGKVIERGYDVRYDTALKLISAFDARQFRRGREYDEDPTERYFECDLLMIDDLGTEVVTPYTSAWMYEIINDRMTRGKATIINTNLTGKDIRRRYDARITSRLFGAYRALVFRGEDMRWQRLKQ